MTPPGKKPELNRTGADSVLMLMALILKLPRIIIYLHYKDYKKKKEKKEKTAALIFSYGDVHSAKKDMEHFQQTYWTDESTAV